MPMLALIGHLALVNANVFPAGIAVLCIEALIAAAAVGATLAHDVPLSAKCLFTLKAAEVAHVPVATFGLCTLICKDDLITGLTARFKALGVVPPTVDLAILVEVDEVNKELPTGGANETLGVPAGAMPCSAGKNCNVPATDLLPTLLTNGSSYSDREETDSPAAEILPLSLL